MSRQTLQTGARQSGLTFLGWIVVIMVVGGIATLCIRLIPHYIDHRTMLTIFEALPAERVHAMSRGEIMEALQKRFRINNIRGLELRDIIEIDRQRDGTVILLHYEIREPLAGNVDLVITFDDRFDYQ